MAAEGTRFAAQKQGAPSGASRRCASCGESYPLDFVVCPKDATALLYSGADDEDPLIGEVIAGAFCVTSPLGEGGMGRVYAAEHVRLPRRFAIKVMQEELLKYPDAIARFEREAQAVARVSSEHVIEVVDLIRLKDGRPCLVTELLEGQELGELLEARGKLPVATAITIARQVCRGLTAAHAVGVVHRDLKPSNLFLVTRADGLPFAKILDFGVAKLADGANLTRTGMVVGTPAYMSPEQARGDKGVDERADVYSLGAVLFHMITGSPPFGGDEPGVVLTKVLTEDAPSPRSVNPSVPDVLDAIVLRALSRDAQGRPGSAAELEADLQALERPAPVEPAPSSRVVFSDLTMIAPPPQIIQKEAPPRWSRAGVVIAIATFAAGVAAVGLAAGAAVVRLYDPRAKLRSTELALLIVVAAVVAVVLAASGLRMLMRRWEKVADVDRVGAAFGAALTTLLAGAGLLAIAWADVGVVTASALAPARLPMLDVVMMAAPLGAAALVFLFGVGRAKRTRS